MEWPMEGVDPIDPEWVAECLLWRGRVLTGRERHYCFEWDGLPIDETTLEWPCGCETTGATDG